MEKRQFESEYKKRLIDEKLDIYLRLFGGVCITGPKWCGKTWASLNKSKSSTFLSDINEKKLAQINPTLVFKTDYPQLIDEWQLVPSIWDSIRNEIDRESKKGKFILTGSTTLFKENDSEEIFHSGTGRIKTLKMETMSLYESNDSTNDISINDLLNDSVISKRVKDTSLVEIAQILVRGGWPSNIDTEKEFIHIMPQSYIETLITKDIHENSLIKRDSDKMLRILKSISRNISTLVSLKTIVKDVEEYSDDDYAISRNTVSDYLNVLDSLNLLTNQSAFSINYRSSSRVGKLPKRHLVDPSLACAALKLTPNMLLQDLETFGLLFESLVIRDLRIYMNYFDGTVSHFRDNVSGDEVDAILEFSNGDFAAIEVKLNGNSIDDAKKSLKRFYDNVKKKPKFMCVICGYYNAIYKDEETGIFVIPFTSLKPF